jgi:hypothetical protein
LKALIVFDPPPVNSGTTKKWAQPRLDWC